MLINLNIQKDVDYYVFNNVKRPCDAQGNLADFKTLRYVNTFLNPKVPAACAGAPSTTASLARLCPQGTTQPLNEGQAPPPLKPQHRGYSNLRLNAYFRVIEEQNPKLAWNFREALYAPPTPTIFDDYMAMKCLAHTYGGKLARLRGKNANLRGLIGQAANDTQIIGLLGHGFRVNFAGFIETWGRIVVGQQQIIEPEDPMHKLKKKPANSIFLNNPKIQQSFQDLGKKISPLAVIVLYHCHNGVRQGFLQTLADLVDRPIFAFTGFLGWFTMDIKKRRPAVAKIEKKWNSYSKEWLLKQEFNYHPQRSEYFSPPEGDWVVAIPKRFDLPIFDKLEKDFRIKVQEFEKLEAGARPMA